MKFDLDSFKSKLSELVSKGEITEDTASTYYYCLKRIHEKLKNTNINSIELKNAILNKAKSKESIVNYVAAVRKYEDQVLERPKGLLFGEPEAELFSVKKNMRVAKNTEFKHSKDTVIRKINALKNKKIKYALRLQLKSGLRIKEISELTKKDIQFNDDGLKVQVRQGKGRKSRIVDVIEDPYLVEGLKEFVKDYDEGDKLFYSRSYLTKKAAALDIETHDLRRINAQERVKGELDKGKSREEAQEVAKRQLGHEKVRTTRIYLSYKHKKIK